MDTLTWANGSWPLTNRIGSNVSGLYAVLVAAEDGRLRPFTGPDLAETHCLQRCRPSVWPDEIVLENACVRAPSRNTADQQVGARRRAGRCDPRAGGSIERLELGDLAELGAVAVVQGALQIYRRPAVQ